MKSIGYDGSETTATVDVEVNQNLNLTPYMYVDSPKTNDTVYGDEISIKGWAINQKGVKAVHIYVNGVKKTVVGTWLPRNDVHSLFPQYQNSDRSGFKANIAKQEFNKGLNTVVFLAVGDDGKTSTAWFNVNIK